MMPGDWTKNFTPYISPVTAARQKKRLAKRKQERQNKKTARQRS